MVWPEEVRLRPSGVNVPVPAIKLEGIPEKMIASIVCVDEVVGAFSVMGERKTVELPST